MSNWDYTDVYVAACLRTFNTHREGREHERECPECQSIILGNLLNDESEADLCPEEDEDTNGPGQTK